MDLAGLKKKTSGEAEKIGIMENFPIYTDEHTSDSLLQEHAFSTGLKWFTPFLKALRFENAFKDMLTKPKGRNQSYQ